MYLNPSLCPGQLFLIVALWSLWLFVCVFPQKWVAVIVHGLPIYLDWTRGHVRVLCASLIRQLPSKEDGLFSDDIPPDYGDFYIDLWWQLWQSSEGPERAFIYSVYHLGCGFGIYTIYAKYVDSAISATPVADRFIKLSTQPCNLHRQTLAIEWPYWRAQWLSTWHLHRMPPFKQVSSSNFCPARAAPVNCKCCYCEVETFRSNNGSAAKW
jgi:hypothetical protein